MVGEGGLTCTDNPVSGEGELEEGVRAWGQGTREANMKTQTSGDHDLNQRDRGGSPIKACSEENGQPVGRDGGLKRTPGVSTQCKRVVGGDSSLAWEHRS